MLKVVNKRNNDCLCIFRNKGGQDVRFAFHVSSCHQVLLLYPDGRRNSAAEESEVHAAVRLLAAGPAPARGIGCSSVAVGPLEHAEDAGAGGEEIHSPFAGGRAKALGAAARQKVSKGVSLSTKMHNNDLR